MNWEAIGAIGEITGAAAVVASLLYLAVQTRENARSMRANALWNAETAFGSINYDHAKDPEFAHLLTRAFSATATISDFSETEISQLQFTVRAAMQYFQAQWALWNEGILPDSLWERRRKFIREFIEIPVLSELWKLEVSQYVIDEDFRRDIEAIVPQGNVSLGVNKREGT